MPLIKAHAPVKQFLFLSLIIASYIYADLPHFGSGLMIERVTADNSIDTSIDASIKSANHQAQNSNQQHHQQQLQQQQIAITSITPAIIPLTGSDNIIVRGNNFTAQTQISVADMLISDVQFISSNELRFKLPMQTAPGLLTLSVIADAGIHNAGVAQMALKVIPPTLDQSKAKFITTIAGGIAYLGDGDLASKSTMIPSSVVSDSSGNIFVADSLNHRVRRIDNQTKIVTTIAGTGNIGFNGDDQLAITANLFTPTNLCLDSAGNLYFTDLYQNRVRRIDAITGIITTVGGNGKYGVDPITDGIGDGGLATEATINYPAGLAIDAQDNLYIGEIARYRIRRIDAKTKIITSIAGNGFLGESFDGALAVNSQIGSVYGIAIDRDQNIFYTDAEADQLRRIDAQTGILTTIPLDNIKGGCEDLLIHTPSKIVFDESNRLYVLDQNNIILFDVAKRSGTQLVCSISGNSDNDGPIGNAQLNFNAQDVPNRLITGSIALDNNNNLLLAELSSGTVKRLNMVSKTIDTIAGSRLPLFDGDGGEALTARFNNPNGIAVNSQGDIYIADTENNRIRKIDHSTGIITTVAGDGNILVTKDGPALQTSIVQPINMTIDRDDNLVFIIGYMRVVRLDTRLNEIKIVGGSGSFDFDGDNQPATQAGMNPSSILVDKQNNLIITDFFNHRIRKIDAKTGIIKTIVGGGKQAQLNFPFTTVMDRAGNLYIGDNSGDLLRKVDAQTGDIATVLTKDEFGNFIDISDLAIDSKGIIYIVNSLLNRVITFNPETKKVTPFAGQASLSENRVTSYFGDGFKANIADLNFTSPAFALVNVNGRITIDNKDNVYIADIYNNAIRVVKGKKAARQSQ